MMRGVRAALSNYATVVQKVHFVALIPWWAAWPFEVLFKKVITPLSI